MRNHPNAVTIQPYFRVHPGDLDTIKASLPCFIEVTSKEPKCIFYGFTLATTPEGDELFCQEAYEDAEGVLAHLRGVEVLLAELLTRSRLIRFEIHGPAAEIEALRAPLASLNPTYFVYECGLE